MSHSRTLALCICALQLITVEALAQCDSFRIDFNLQDTLSSVQVCRPGTFRMDDFIQTNKGDSVTVRCWFVNGKPKYPSTIWDVGKFDVKYKVATKNGCEDSLEKNGYIEVRASRVKLSYDDTSYCTGAPVWLRDSTNWVGENAKIYAGIDGYKSARQIIDVNGSSAYKILNKPRSARFYGIPANYFVQEEVLDPNTNSYVECYDMYPHPFSIDKNRNMRVTLTDGPKVFASANHLKLTIDSPHLYTDHYWLLISNWPIDTIAIHDSTSIEWPKEWRQVELHVFDGECQNAMRWLPTSMPEVLHELNLAFSAHSNRLMVKNPTGEKVVVKIYNLSGMLEMKVAVSDVEETFIDISDLSRGCYVASLETTKNRLAIRFLKN